MFYQPNIVALLLMLLALSLPSQAQTDRPALNIDATTYRVDVDGIVCEFCALGVAKKVRKLTFIDAARFKKGVKVDINNQQVFVAVRDNAQLDKAALFKAIESGGYKPLTITADDSQHGGNQP